MTQLPTTQIVSSTLYMLSLCAALGWSKDCRCGLPGVRVPFKSCKQRQAEWRPHDHEDIGLAGDCLPNVPANTMKCYKWRTAEQCTSGHHLHCALKDRLGEEKASEYLQVISDSLITLHSPNSERERPYYLNNNFCVYNVSLNCPGKIISLQSKLDYALSDGETRQDYLWFSTSSTGHSQRIYGNEIIDFSDTLHTQSFTSILWSDNDRSEGKFEIEVRCTDLSIPTTDPELSSDMPLSATD